MTQDNRQTAPRQWTAAGQFMQLLANSGKAARLLADFIWGEECVCCAGEVPVEAVFCPSCASSLVTISPPWCPRCGLPYQSPPSHLCGQCASNSPPTEQIRAWALYLTSTTCPNPVATAIQRFKYGKQRRIGQRLARTLVTLAPDRRYDSLIPVPLEPRRLRQRGFNQAQVLAVELGKALSLKANPFTLVRWRATDPQVGSDYNKRQANVAGAFAVARPATIAGARVLLVDDVVTSGATLRACAQTLLAAGAAMVDAVAVARTVKA